MDPPGRVRVPPAPLSLPSLHGLGNGRDVIHDRHGHRKVSCGSVTPAVIGVNCLASGIFATGSIPGFTFDSCPGHKRNGVWVGSRVTKVNGGRVIGGRVLVGWGVDVSVGVAVVGGRSTAGVTVEVGEGVVSAVGVVAGVAVGGEVTVPGVPSTAGVRTGPGADWVGVPDGAASSGVQA